MHADFQSQQRELGAQHVAMVDLREQLDERVRCTGGSLGVRCAGGGLEGVHGGVGSVVEIDL